MFTHSDEASFSKMTLIQWIHRGKCNKVVKFWGGFHTLMVNLKVLYKKYGALGLREWWVDSEAVAEGSS